jgi:hypothetical protein
MLFGSLSLTLALHLWMSHGIDPPFLLIALPHILVFSILCFETLVETPSLWFQLVLSTMVGKARQALIHIHLGNLADTEQDGLPMICIILRNIDTETTDYELLLFGYLKVS